MMPERADTLEAIGLIMFAPPLYSMVQAKRFRMGRRLTAEYAEGTRGPGLPQRNAKCAKGEWAASSGTPLGWGVIRRHFPGYRPPSAVQPSGVMGTTATMLGFSRWGTATEDGSQAPQLRLNSF